VTRLRVLAFDDLAAERGDGAPAAADGDAAQSADQARR
jgi:hypothetical protein